MNKNMNNHDTGSPELNLLLGSFTAIFIVLGISLGELDLIFSVVFKFLSCISVLFIIIINWDKGISIIADKFKRNKG